MRRWLVTIVVAALCVAPLSADLTITTTTSVEGGMAAAAAGAAPKIVTRIKGPKSRTEIETNGQTVVTLIDLTTKQVILLRADNQTAQIIDPSGVSSAASRQPMPMPAIDTVVKPTGQKREINGAQCEEYAVTMKMDMAPMAAGRGDMPPEAAAMLKDLRMNMSGSAWVARNAPGAAEYLSFQSGAAKVALGALSGGGRGGGLPAGMEGLLTGFSEAPGIPYLTEMTIRMEGNSQMAAMMQQMGAMKVIARVTEVSTATLPDTLFAVPDGYKVIKK